VAGREAYGEGARKRATLTGKHGGLGRSRQWRGGVEVLWRRICMRGRKYDRW